MAIIKQFYHTRVQMYYDALLSLPEDCVVVCLPRRGVYILKALMQYATRRANWVQEVIDGNRFIAPDATGWDVIQAVVSETEGCLMSTCDISPIIEALQCICRSTTQQLGTTVAPLATMADTTVENVYEYSSVMPGRGFAGVPDEYSCNVAQLLYALGYELITEIVLPASRFAFDTLVPAVATLIVAVTGGLGLPAIAGVYLTIELIQELFELGYNAAESNITNWLWSVKQEMVCTAYAVLLAGGTAGDVAQAVYNDVVEPSGSISHGDKLICRLFFSSWIITNASIALDQGTPWADENTTAGYCSVCAVPGLHVWSFPPCPAGWQGPGLQCCAAQDVGLKEVYANWYCNYSDVFEIQGVGHYKVTFTVQVYVDFDLWDFPPPPGDRLLRASVMHVATSQVVAEQDAMVADVVSPGWNTLQLIVDDASIMQLGDYRMHFTHKSTNAICTGVRVNRLSVQFTPL